MPVKHVNSFGESVRRNVLGKCTLAIISNRTNEDSFAVVNYFSGLSNGHHFMHVWNARDGGG
jgi:hypothetical protein